jgi:hypothetical protein
MEVWFTGHLGVQILPILKETVPKRVAPLTDTYLIQHNSKYKHYKRT